MITVSTQPCSSCSVWSNGSREIHAWSSFCSGVSSLGTILAQIFLMPKSMRSTCCIVSLLMPNSPANILRLTQWSTGTLEDSLSTFWAVPVLPDCFLENPFFLKNENPYKSVHRNPYKIRTQNTKIRTNCLFIIVLSTSTVIQGAFTFKSATYCCQHFSYLLSTTNAVDRMFVTIFVVIYIHGLYQTCTKPK